MKWISVKDRMPDDRTLILLNSNGLICVGFYVEGNKDECEHDEDCDCIYNEEKDMYLMQAGFKEQVLSWPDYDWLDIIKGSYVITHWMPLPKPPTNDS